MVALVIRYTLKLVFKYSSTCDYLKITYFYVIFLKQIYIYIH